MSKNIIRGLSFVLATGALTLFGAMAANADIIGDDGLLTGSQAPESASAPVTVNGTGISILPNPSSSDGVLSTGVLANGPVTINQLPDDQNVIGGFSFADLFGTPTLNGVGTGSTTSESSDVSAPVKAQDNWLSLFGNHYAVGSIDSGVESDGSSQEVSTPGDDGLIGDHQVKGTAYAPVNASCNDVAILGSGAGGCQTSSANSGITAPVTLGNESALGDSNVDPSATAPATATCNSVSVLGDASGCAEPADTTTEGGVVPTDPNGGTGMNNGANGAGDAAGAADPGNNGSVVCSPALVSAAPAGSDTSLASTLGGIGAIAALASMALVSVIRKVKLNA